MNEMKPEDVMRALECCASGTGGDACNGCPFNERNVCDNDMNALEKAALALLREKDAEIERYKGVIRLLEKDVADARSEAITEFEQRLITYYNALKSGLVAYHIEQVAKEMRDKL